jgi:hypothetical protein
MTSLPRISSQRDAATHSDLAAIVRQIYAMLLSLSVQPRPSAKVPEFSSFRRQPPAVCRATRLFFRREPRAELVVSIGAKTTLQSRCRISLLRAPDLEGYIIESLWSASTDIAALERRARTDGAQNGGFS